MNLTRWFKEGVLIYLNSIIILLLYVKKMRDNGKFLVDEFRNRLGNVFKNINSV